MNWNAKAHISSKGLNEAVRVSEGNEDDGFIGVFGIIVVDAEGIIDPFADGLNVVVVPRVNADADADDDTAAATAVITRFIISSVVSISVAIPDPTRP